jgi:hypothetical protein
MANSFDPSWDVLRESLETSDAAFVLGAGVSEASGFPSWEKLANALARRERLDGELLMRQFELPTAFSLIRGKMRESGREVQWVDALRTALYADFFAKLGEDGEKEIARLLAAKRPCKKIERKLRRSNRTLASFVRLCARKDGDGTLSVSRRVRAVLTYNFDALVQIYDRARHGHPRVFRTVERASKPLYRSGDHRERGKIPLYHLHGYLKPRRGDKKGEAPDKIVLCEDDYHKWTDSPFGFGSTAVLHSLRELVCIFIGCSLKDELMRRSLSRARREFEAARKAEGRTESLPRHFAVCDRRRQDLDEWQRKSLEILGVQPLWVVDFDHDLRCQLRRLEDEFHA